jgi:hypothetical protein
MTADKTRRNLDMQRAATLFGTSVLLPMSPSSMTFAARRKPTRWMQAFKCTSVCRNSFTHTAIISFSCVNC